MQRQKTFEHCLPEHNGSTGGERTTLMNIKVRIHTHQETSSLPFLCPSSPHDVWRPRYKPPPYSGTEKKSGA